MSLTMGLLVMILVNACGKLNSKEIEGKQKNRFPDSFQKGLRAHGGLDLWNSYGTLEFTEIIGTDIIKHVVDLKNRNERIEKKGKYAIGFTADSISIYPDKDSFPGKNPRFYQNLVFYFFAVHFVTADEGAIQQELEPLELEGKMYNRIKVTFEEGVGYSSKDQYILWYDQKTNLLKMINYSVTYYDESRAENYSAIVYNNWREIGGIQMPGEIVGYTWGEGSLGKKKIHKNVRRYKLFY